MMLPPSLTVPSSASDQRVWLDSISTTLEADTTLNDSALLSFVDTYWESDSVASGDNSDGVDDGDDSDDDGKEDRTSITFAPSAISSLSCYPNPVTEDAYISFSTNSNLRLSIRLYDLFGKEITVLEEGYYTISSHRNAISKSKYNLSGGIYLIRLTGENNLIQTFKLSVR